MFNLLPESIKDKIKSEYSTRRVVVALFFVVAIQFSVLIFTFPSWVVSYTRESEVKQQTVKLNQSTLSSGANDIKQKIASINTKINTLSTSLDYPKLSPYVEYMLSKKTNSIKIYSFSYTSNNEKTAILTIRGTASTRESLVSFVESLKMDKKFSKVDLPVSDLAKSKDIDFSVITNISI